MTKKVATRSWSLEKFTKSVKAECKRLDVKFHASKVQKAYDDNWSVRFTLAHFDNLSAARKG